MKQKFASALSLALILAMLFTSVGLASEVNVAVVDVTAPFTSVTLAPGGSGPITINMTVTGKQDGTATFEVNRDWTLTNGGFVGSNPQQFTVGPRTAQDPATVFTTTGTVSVVAPQSNGTFTLAVSTFDITNSNTTGAKLADGADGIYYITVSAPIKTTPTITWSNPANITYGTALSGIQLNATASVPGSFVYSPAAGTILNAGSNQNLHVDFTPSDTSSYNNASKDVKINVLQATSSVTLTCPVSVSYSGLAQMPCTASYSTSDGLSGTLAVSYSNNTNVGTASATANYAGDANHAGNSGLASFSIQQATSTTTVSCGDGPFTYTGSAQTPCTASFTTSDGQSGSLTVNYSNNFNAGTATASASYTGDANHAGSSDSKDFVIGQAVSTTTVTCEDGPFTFNGSAQEPCTASYSTSDGQSGSLPVTYSNNVSAGTASASASYAGDANHVASSESKTFTIDKAATTTALYCQAGPFIYDGTAKTPCSATVTGPGGLNQSITVSYNNNVNAGTAIASASYAGNSNYKPSSDSQTFTIDKAASETVVTCDAGPFTYTGSAIEPCSAAVTGAGGLNQALTVSYTDNINAGTATASATFAGDSNYYGSDDSKTFTIDKASSTTTVTCPAGVTYDGNAQTPCSATVTGAGASSKSLTVTYSNNTNAGTASASASYGGDDNHLSSNDSATFTIDKAVSAVALTCPANVTYTGTALTPCKAEVTGAGGLSQTLTVSYDNNINAGTATASASYAGDDNHKEGSNSTTFTIDPAPSTTVVTCAAGPFYYTGSPITPCSASITGAGGLNQTLMVSYSNNVNPGTATAAAVFAGDENHTGSNDSKTFQILAWTLKGFYQPVDMNGVLNTVKNGSTVPLKFEIFAGNTELTLTSAVKNLTYTAMSCSSLPTDDIELTATGQTVLRYDTTSGQFIFNWKTPSTAGACYKVTMTAQDGSTLQANFKLK